MTLAGWHVTPTHEGSRLSAWLHLGPLMLSMVWFRRGRTSS